MEYKLQERAATMNHSFKSIVVVIAIFFVAGGLVTTQLISCGCAEDAISVKSLGAKGDGISDDTKSIEGALQKGTRILFPQGTYLVSKTIIVDSGKTLTGEGAIIGYHSAKSYPLFVIKGTKNRIEGITFSGNSTYFTSAGGDMVESPYTLLRIEGNGNTIYQCRFTSIDAYGIYIRGGSSNNIENNQFGNLNPLAPGVRGRYGLGIAGGQRNSTVNSYFENLSTAIAAAWTGIPARQDTFLNAVSFNRYCDNHIKSMSEHGIYISSGSHESVTNNTVENVWGVGIKCRAILSTVSRNLVNTAGKMEGPAATGIVLQAPASNNTISDNTIFSKRFGIELGSYNLSYVKDPNTKLGFPSDYKVVGNKAVNNVVTCTMAEGENAIETIGIRILEGDIPQSKFTGDYLVNGNTINNYNTGIWAHNFSGGVISNNRINTTRTYSGSDTRYGNGISLTGQNSGCTIKDNIINGFSGNGLYATGVETSILANEIRNSGGYGIVDASPRKAGNTILRNILSGNKLGQANVKTY